MTTIRYQVVEHDGGWAYKLGDVYSETFPSHDIALKAAKAVAQEQQVGGETEAIEYQDENGAWHVELARGGDRPQAEVVDEG